MCTKTPVWNIPSIANLYKVEEKSSPFPLENLKLIGDITNSSASLSFIQTFKNDSEVPIECIYKFPSDYSFAVVGLTVKIGDKTIKAEVMEKKQAEAKYDDALAAGHTAIKLNYDEKLPDIIELNIGQFQPGDTAEITVKMVCELEVIKHGFFSLIFPLDFFPRYGNKEGILGELGEYLPSNFEAEFTIRSSSEITNLDVSHENMEFEQSDDNKEIVLTLASSSEIIAKDIVISYSTEQIREPQIILTKMSNYPQEIAAIISFIPRSSEEHQVDNEENKINSSKLTELDDHDNPDIANGEFIFIIDRSGSMTGSKIKIALDALELFFIRSIPQNSKFNIISFGHNFVPLYEESIVYNQNNMEKTIDKIKKFEADLGGTELLDPVNYVLSSTQSFEYPRNVFILTDGGISNTESLLTKIEESNNHTRIHSFGIGSGASIYLVKEIAKAGKGTSTIIPDNDKHLASKVINALNKAAKPAFTNISINWKKNSGCIQLQYPNFKKSFYVFMKKKPFEFTQF